MAADASILADQFFKEAYVLPGVVGDGYGLLGPIGGRPEERNTIQAFLESQNKEAFDAYKSLFVKFKELVNTRKRVIAADSPIAAAAAPAAAPAAAAPAAAPAAAAPAAAAPAAAPAAAAPAAAPAAAAPAAAPGINSHTKNELNKQYEKQLKELAASISDSSSLKDIINGNVDIIARNAAAAADAVDIARMQIRIIFTEFLKIRVKGGLERGKFLMDELFDEPAAGAPTQPNLHAIGLKTVIDSAAIDTETLSNFKRKYAYLKEVYPEEDKNFIHNVLSILDKENSYNLDLQYTLAKSVPEFIPFTQAGRLVKDLKTYIQSGSPEAADAATLAATERETEAAFITAFQEKESKRAALNQINAQLARDLHAVRQAKPNAKAPGASPAAIQAFRAAVRSLRETNTSYNKASALLQKATAESRVAFNNHSNAKINNAPRPEVTAAMKDGTIPRGTPIVTALKILELRGLDLTNVPLLKTEIEKVDKYIKAVAAIEGLREKKDDPDDPVTYVQKRSEVNTLFTEKGFIEFFSRHLPEGFIEKLETEANYKELLKEAIYGQELKETDEAEEAEEGGEAEEAVKEARRGKVLYKEADDSYKVEKLGFFDKLAGKALSKKELAEWWKKRGGKFNIGQTIPEPIVTIFTETFNLKKKSKKTVHFTENFLIEGVKGDGASLDDATSRLASSSGPAPAAAAPAPAEEISAKGFANKGVYDQEDGPPISSIDVKSGTMFEMYYLGWLDKNVPPAPAPPAAAPPVAAPAAAAAPASSPAYTPQQKKAITKMMKSLFSFVFSDGQVRDANKEKRFHDAYRIAYTVLEKHQKIPCKAENPDLHKYFKKSLEYRKEIAIRELAATKMLGREQLLGMQDHYKQLITGLSGLITFLDNAVEGQPCIVYGDTLAGDPVQVETGSIDTRYILQVFRNHIRMRRDGAPPPGKDILMKELTLTGVPLEDVDAVYKQISDMLTDYAKLTKENPVLRDLVVLFSQIALYLQQLGNIRLELERLQRQIDKCMDHKEKQRLQEQFAVKEREFRVARADLIRLQERHDQERDDLERRLDVLEQEDKLNQNHIRTLYLALLECRRLRVEAEAEVARLRARIAELELRLEETIRGRDIALARIPELDAELAALEAAKDAEIADLTARLAGLEAEKGAAAGTIAQLEAELLNARKEDPRIADLTARLAALRAEKGAADGRIAELEAELLNARKEDPRIADLTARLAALQAEGAAAKNAELDGLRAEVGRLEIELLQCRKALGIANQTIAEQAARIRELDAEIDRLRKENARLLAENDQLREALDKCNEERGQLQGQLDALLAAPPVGDGGGGGGSPEPPPSPAPSLGEGEEEQLPEQRFLTPEQRNEVFFFLNKVFINWVVQSGSILSRYTGVDRKDESIIDGIPVGSLLNSIKSILTDLRTKIDARKYGVVLLNDKKKDGNHIKDFREFMHNAYVIWTTGKDTGFNANRFRRFTLILFKLAYMYISTKFCPDGDEYCSKNYILDIYRTMDGYNYDEQAGYMVKDRYIEHLLQKVFNPKKVFNPSNLEAKTTETLINYLFLYTYLENTFAIDSDDNVFFMDKYNSHPHTPLNEPQYFYNIKWEDPKSLRYFIQHWNARLGRGAGAAAGGGPRRPQIGGARKTSVKSLSQGMLLLFLVELRKSKQLKSAKEVQDLVNKAGKALDSIGQYELVLTILQGVMEHTNTNIQDGYTYVNLGSMKKEKANALIESYNEVFDKSDSQMFKTLGTPGSFHASAPEEFEEVLGKGPFCLVLAKGKGESKEETPLHGVSDEYEVVLEEKERKVLEDNGGIPLGGVIFLYLVCLNELYCDSSDEECIRPTR